MEGGSHTMSSTNNQASSASRLSTQSLVLTALMTAVTCILAPMSIPIPFSPVPLTLTNFVLEISIFLLGWKKATASFIIYLLMGLCGLPVFSGFSGGVGKFAGPTGGYLIGFLFLTVIGGLFAEHFHWKRSACTVGMVLGMAVTYAFGTAWLCFQLNLSFTAGLFTGVIPYLPGDAVKIALAVAFGPVLKKRVR